MKQSKSGRSGARSLSGEPSPKSGRSGARARREPRPPPPTRAWFATGFALLGIAALLGAARAGPLITLPGAFAPLIAVTGSFLVAGGLAYGFAPPFLKREILAPRLSPAIPAVAALAVLAGLVALAWRGQGDGLRVLMAGCGLALALAPSQLVLSAFLGPAWRGGIALFAQDQPFRRGDALAAASFGLGMLGAAAAGIAWLLPPRGIPSAGFALALCAGLLPFFAGVLLFLLPRNAKAPLEGATLVGAALLAQTLGAAGLAFAFARPLGADFRWPGAALALSTALFLAAMLRIRFPAHQGVQLQRARPFLQGAFALAILCALVLVIATVTGTPGELLGLALLAYAVLAAQLSAACALLGAPILLNAVPREGGWARWSASLSILSLFLLAPAFQHPRPAFPGALVLLLATLLLLWGLWPMRKPRRAC